jgi:hydrogenase maturation protein HypF
VTAAARIEVAGVVQGVGFRPFVYTLARERGLTGWVNNTAEGVTIVVEGDPATVASFADDVWRLAPPMAVVQAVSSASAEPQGFASFEIRASDARGDLTLVSPDIATCPACLADMLDPANRRHGYAFTNCTNCGPRFTIVESLPYDRPATSMKAFEMCPECAAEYADPADRRFHAQPNACHVCGPRLYLNGGGAPEGLAWSDATALTPLPERTRDGEAARSADVLRLAAGMLLDGRILAIKGLGGFHLACDATSETAVAELRTRKRRWGKPLAIMLPDLAAARALCEVGDEEAALLEGTRRPIVLLRLRSSGVGEGATGARAASGTCEVATETRCAHGAALHGRAEVSASAADARSAGPGGDPHQPDPGAALAPSVAPGLAELGVMLPYTPLHHLLMDAVGGRPLVMTSGNVSEEPIAIDNAEALERLSPIADAFLLHDREIRQRYDDSVVRVVAGATELVRRSRGYAPFPLRLPFSTDVHILATGPEQKSTFCLARETHAFVSQHIGDMENAETLEAYERTLALYQEMFRVRPALVAYDLHPEYLSTKFALSLGLPSIGVQHHHAHVASVTAEHGFSGKVVGIAYDGTGYGTDGTIWGGEVLLADWSGFERFAHLRQMPMPGGAAAIRRPARMASGLLSGLDEGLFDHPGASILQSSLTSQEHATLRAMADRRLNSPSTSSMGRLFDAVAALSGVRADALYEGQAAIELEALADRDERGAYEFGLVGDSPVVIDPEPVVRAILDDLAAGVGAPAVSARFHNAVVRVTVEVAVRACGQTSLRHVALAGGVFMNRIVLAGVRSGLEAAGLVALTHRDLPMNDGDVSFGQAVVAWARRDTV